MTKLFHQSHIFVFPLLGSDVTFLLKHFVCYTCYEVCTFNIGVTPEGIYIAITSLII